LAGAGLEQSRSGMSVPEHLRRHPTRAAIDALAARFDLPNHPGMQDWEWEVADHTRLDEFIGAYQSGDLDDDERFTLMEIIIQSFEDLGARSEHDPRWQCILDILDRNVELHACSVWYWSALDGESREEQFSVTPSMRSVLARHRARLETPR
jgi:hypothetical protein